MFDQIFRFLAPFSYILSSNLYEKHKNDMMRNKRAPSVEGIIMLLFWLFSLSILTVSTALDTITVNQSVRDGETLVSAGESFELGFFGPGNSKNRYLGIWYKKDTGTVVWVANRDIPLHHESGVLKVTELGILALVDAVDGMIIWSSNSSRFTQHPVAKLLDTGNFVVQVGNDDKENFLWQSFDHPCDTILPGMKIGINKVTDLERYVTSWKSDDDPAQGDYSFRLDANGYPQVFLRKGSIVKYRTGPWNGVRFGGPTIWGSTVWEDILKPSVILNHGEVYFSFEVLNKAFLSRVVLNQNGIVHTWIWTDPTRGWLLYHSSPIDNCDIYGLCGAYGSCNIGHVPPCGCLDKFVPKDPANWDRTDWSNGCIRRTPLNCSSGDRFLKYSNIRLPDARHSSFHRKECEAICLKNCSCVAFADSDIRREGSGCLVWFDDLIDLREYPQGGQDIYIRMASSELIGRQDDSNGKKGKTIIMSLALSIGLFLLVLILISYAWKKKKQMRLLKRKELMERLFKQGHKEYQKEDLQLPLFDFSTIVNATSNFSINNKLGEGGFGPVYKGVLEDGQEIAVKRLSKNSGQGLNEFKNEVSSIAKLQHRNLVKLLGCYINVEEKMLIYEYMPNKSLDFFIFDQTRSMLLDWPKRFHIINGIARGLLYLHQDSRLRVIHRDLKASNILLDEELNPKISDFGLAKSFGGTETKANTNRVIGTYGYMSPEYAMYGLYSVKSDVFSFGVVVLEIISGKKNRVFPHPDNLLGHAWRLFKEGRSLELIDSSIRESCTHSEVLHTIHVGLLCAQQSRVDRPSMSSVVLMLSGDSILPQPKHPGYVTEMIPRETNFLPSELEEYSANEVTITLLGAR